MSRVPYVIIIYGPPSLTNRTIANCALWWRGSLYGSQLACDWQISGVTGVWLLSVRVPFKWWSTVDRQRIIEQVSRTYFLELDVGMDNMQTQLDHNAYSALESDSEESESGELSALLANPDLDVANSLALADLQGPSEAGTEENSVRRSISLNQPLSTTTSRKRKKLISMRIIRLQ